MFNPYYVQFDPHSEKWNVWLKEGPKLHSHGYPTKDAAERIVKSLLYDMENPS